MTPSTPSLPCFLPAIPRALRFLPQWVVWKLLDDESGRSRKMPIDPNTGRSAKAGQPDTWGTFEQAAAAYQTGKYAGIGFQFHTTDPFLGGDIDDCRNPDTGELTPEAQAVVAALHTYTEVSPSGTGIKFIAIAQKAGNSAKRGDVEMYDKARFFTLTGHRVAGTPEEPQPRQDECAALYSRWFPANTADAAPKPAPPVNLSLSDTELLEKARNARNGVTFDRLWNGDLTGHGNDHSRGDLALCGLLAFWTQGDPQQIERLFSQSALGQRDKWQTRPDYREGTITQALAGKTEFYSPHQTRTERAATVAQSVRDGQAAEDQSSSSETQERPESNPGDPFETIQDDIHKLRVQLRAYGVSFDPTKPMLPPTYDREDYKQIGLALKKGRDRIGTVMNYIWAKWYNDIPAKPQGLKLRLVAELFGGMGSVKTLNERNRLSELAGVYKRIPADGWRWDCPWTFYERLARFTDVDRQRYWLEQKPYKGMYADMDAELKPVQETAVPVSEEATPYYDTEGGVFSYTTPPTVSYDGPKTCESTTTDAPPHLCRMLVMETGEVMEFAATDIDRLQRLAAQANLSPDAYLTTLLDSAELNHDKVHLPRVEDHKFSDITENFPAMTPPKPTCTTPHEAPETPAVQTAEPPTPCENAPEVTPAVPLRFSITPEEEETVQKNALLRKQGNDKWRSLDESHGSDAANLDKDAWGLRGETFAAVLQRHGIPATSPIPFAVRPPSEPDFRIGATTFDIVAVPPDQPFINITAGKQENPARRPKYHVVCLFLNQSEYEVVVIAASKVDTWEKHPGALVNGTRRKPYYRLRRQAVKPITSLNGFARFSLPTSSTDTPEAATVSRS